MAQEKPPAKKIKTMVFYKDELGMNPQQVQAITEAFKTFQTTVKKERATLVRQEGELKKLMKRKAPLPEIKTKLRQISDTRFKLRYADIRTSRKVQDTLSAKQMKQWREIQAKVRARKK